MQKSERVKTVLHIFSFFIVASGRSWVAFCVLHFADKTLSRKTWTKFVKPISIQRVLNDPAC